MGNKDLQASACKILSAVAKQDAQCQELLGSIEGVLVTEDCGEIRRFPGEFDLRRGHLT